MILAGHHKFIDQYGEAIYRAAEALYGYLLADPHPRYDVPWTLLPDGSVEFWCECVALVLVTVDEVAVLISATEFKLD